MDLQDVLNGIKKWNACSGDKDMMSKLKGIRALTFSLSSDIESKLLLKQNLHVYPAINKDNEMVFYLVSVPYENKKDIANYIVTAGIEHIVDYGSIPGETAKARIKAWDEHFDGWLHGSIAQLNMFCAFAVPGDDLSEEGQFTIYFGLRPNTSQIVGPSYWSDLILIAPEKMYEDTVMPVPPFGENGAPPKSAFSLIQ